MEVNKIYNMDCLEGLKMLPDGCIDCCVTSPPYFGLRDYGNEGQIGLEPTPDAYIDKMVAVFREFKRLLKAEGTLWVNIGDSYNGSGEKKQQVNSPKQASNKGAESQKGTKVKGLKPKDLIGIPWMLAFALRADGWYLRQDIIWHKPNPMPESVTDRCTKAHEYIFLLSKSQKYYYDHEAIKVEGKDPEDDIRRKEQQKSENKSSPTAMRNGIRKPVYVGGIKHKNLEEKGQPAHSFHKTRNSNGTEYVNPDGKANKRSVWTVVTKPFSEAHFATFPQELIVDCIKAGCPENGVVLDPFMGAGTTALVASKLNRNYIGFELNPDYIKIAEKRLQNELGLFNRA